MGYLQLQLLIGNRDKKFAKELGLKPVITPDTNPQSNGMVRELCEET
jgi:hypothetical protein